MALGWHYRESLNVGKKLLLSKIHLTKIIGLGADLVRPNWLSLGNLTKGGLPNLEGKGGLKDFLTSIRG